MSTRPHSCCKKSSNSAFTLIELLVVIAIISILAAILFPVFAKVREKARQTMCNSNMRQLGLAVQQYIQDYDEQLPCAETGSSGAKQVGGWIYYANSVSSSNDNTKQFDPTKGSIYSYIKSTQVFVCPDDSVGQTTGDSYAINQCVENGPTGFRPGQALAHFDQPSNTMLFSEEDAGFGSTNDGFQALSFGSAPSYTGNFDSIAARHTDGVNVTFVDGHTKYYHTYPQGSNVGALATQKSISIHTLGLQTGTIVPEIPGTTQCP